MILWVRHMTGGLADMVNNNGQPTPPTMKDAFQKKVQNERRHRRTTRKGVASMGAIPSNRDHPAKRGSVQ